MAKKLPIDEMTDIEFESLRTTVLNKEALSKMEIHNILEYMGLNTPALYSRAVVSCDEAHDHRYPCLQFTSRYDALVYRLGEEVFRYIKKLEDIKNLAEKK